MIGFDNQWRDSFEIDRGARTFMGAARFVMWSKFTVFTSCGKFFCFLVLCFWGSSSSSLGVSEPLVFGVESAGLFENPIISVGMVSRLSESAVNLTYPIQDFV